jgi:hypothetical protein
LEIAFEKSDADNKRLCEHNEAMRKEIEAKDKIMKAAANLSLIGVQAISLAVLRGAAPEEALRLHRR